MNAGSEIEFMTGPRRDHRHARGLAVATALALVGLAGCASDKPPPAPDVGRVEVDWVDPQPCEPADLQVRVEGEDGVTLEFLGRTEQISGGAAEFLLTGAELDGHDSVEVTGTKAGGSVTFQIDPPRSYAGPEFFVAPLEDVDGDIGLHFNLTVGDSMDPRHSGTGYIDANGDGVALLEGCRMTAVTVDGLAATTDARGRFVARFPGLLAAAYDDSDGSVGSLSEAPQIEITGENGRSSKPRSSLRFHVINVLASLPGSHAAPAPFIAPFDAQAGPAQVAFKDVFDPFSAMDEGTTVRDITHVATVSLSHEDVDKLCGPYKDTYDIIGKYFTRRKTHADVVLYEARTGDEIARKHFAGKRPKCPSAALYTEGEANTIDGAFDRAAVTRWARKAAR